ncbi:MAG: methylated-DNA--[protein]-cysteine S-methyltransferase [Bacteroidia bacterium]
MSYTQHHHSPIGVIEIKANSEHIEAVIFHDEPILSKENPNHLTDLCFQQLETFFKGELKKFELPLLQPGTDFQQRVWSELCTISYGKTISYLELAKKLGDPKCIRAAGSANGKNNIAIIVPCHRVIGSNNKLVGYAGGLWRKQWLLEHENKFGNGKLSLF